MKNVIGGYALGDRNFADWLWKEFVDGREDLKISGLRSLKPKVELGAVVNAVSKTFNVARFNLFIPRSGHHGVNIPRGIALYIMSKYSEMTQREIGEAVGGIRGASVSDAVRRMEKMLKTDTKLMAKCQRVIRTITAS